MRRLWPTSTLFRTIIVVVVVIVVFALASSAYAWYFHNRVLPHTWIGTVPVGGLTDDNVAAHLQTSLDRFQTGGIGLVIDTKTQFIQPDDIGFDLNLTEAIEQAFRNGHQGTWFTQYRSRIAALWEQTHLEAPITVDRGALDSQIGDVAQLIDTGRRDVRLQIVGAKVNLLTDTAPGRAIDQSDAASRVVTALRMLDTTPIPLVLHDDAPMADAALAVSAVTQAQQMTSRALLLMYEDQQFSISREKIGGWIVSEYDGPQLVASLSTQLIAQYVTSIAQKLNISPEPARITTDGGRVTGFTPPKVGRAVQEDKLVQIIKDTLASRAGKDKFGDTIIVPLKVDTMSLVGLDAGVGITELIGKASTRFTGSPKNRISNIKNGVKFLTGAIIQPGNEFSTLGTLGTIDNTTGYLPELVIKGDRTKPEFGGGLCQVSTTLFRAVMNTGLPITARQNHSYRVSYYEKDAEGKLIGPGLDATIYEPKPDFKFLNDTANPILIIGYVSGDKITFELYGTKDGRSSSIDGPHTLTTTPSGEAIMIPEPSLAVGVKKQVETAHAGGSAVATYSIVYADGTKKVQEFKSWYRPWPAQYLVGTGGVIPTPVPVMPVSPPL